MVKLFTSESVTEGHPDKMCDLISDAILDDVLAHDKKARVAIECMVKGRNVFLAGEISSTHLVDFNKIVDDTIHGIGYDYDAKILRKISKQSLDIAQGVDQKEQGAGDQGLMFGYACDETPELMPAPIHYAHKLAQRLTELRTHGYACLEPDGKTQVTFAYDDEGKPSYVDTIVVSTQHSAYASQELIEDVVREMVIKRVIPFQLMNKKTKILVNPTGKFLLGGPFADAGLTGRKIIVDTYGGMGRHGGGCFSGKDPSKVDRSGAYYARFIAKQIVAQGFARKCEVQIAYAIGVAKPVSINIETFGTTKRGEQSYIDSLVKIIDARPAAIIEKLDLLNIKYKPTAAYGHFGRYEFPWEKV